jgi:glycosyltransferase involved in cell wall biosynthesis
MPRVSVIVPTHNRAHLLNRTLRSILAQDLRDLEVIVVDDGSTDDMRRVGDADPRIIVVRNVKRQGVSGARNAGIATARGTWIAFCDDDDLWSPAKLSRQLAAAEQGHADWVYTGDVNVDEQLRVLSGGPPLDPQAVAAVMPRSNPLASGGSNVMVRSQVLAAVGGFDPELRRTEDWDLWIRIARVGPPACVRAPLVAYRFHAGNILVDPAETVAEARRIAERYGFPVDLAAMNHRAAWAALRGGRRMLAARHYGRAIARGDIRSIGRAAVALFHPAVGSDRLFAMLGRDEQWIAQAEEWLNPFASPGAEEGAAR